VPTRGGKGGTNYWGPAMLDVFSSFSVVSLSVDCTN